MLKMDWLTDWLYVGFLQLVDAHVELNGKNPHEYICVYTYIFFHIVK